MILKNKVIIVTGASDGIGKQVAIKLAAQGATLALIARTQRDIVETDKIKFYPCDLRHTKEIETTINKVISDFGKIDILLNIAGIWQKMMPVEEIEESVVDDVIQTNLTGLIHITRLTLPHLKKQKEAAIINVISKSGVVSQAGQSVYTASKYGVRGFTEVLKIDLKDSNIRVAGVYQSGTNTEMFAKVGDHPPVEKFTDPSDLAETIVFMLSRPAKIWLPEVHVEY